MDRFELLGPLPREGTTTVLEASAGTGKTFALAGLVTRYLAETAATLDEMLLITFNRAASRGCRLKPLQLGDSLDQRRFLGIRVDRGQCLEHVFENSSLHRPGQLVAPVAVDKPPR